MRTRPMLPAVAAFLLAGAPVPGWADDVYFTTKTLLADFFERSERVTYVRLETSEVAAELRGLLGYLPKKPSYVVFVAMTGERVDGYAIIDDEMGQHLPITFGVKLTPDGEVARMEIMTYREGYGGEVREPRYRSQFAGRSMRDPIALGDDIVAISGATISSKAMAIGVRRAAAIVHVLLSRNGRPSRVETAAASPSPPAPLSKILDGAPGMGAPSREAIR